MQLERIVPVTAVRGNCDVGDGFRETEVVELGGRRLLVRHEVDVRFTLPRTVGILRCDGSGISATHVAL